MCIQVYIHRIMLSNTGIKFPTLDLCAVFRTSFLLIVDIGSTCEGQDMTATYSRNSYYEIRMTIPELFIMVLRSRYLCDFFC